MFYIFILSLLLSNSSSAQTEPKITEKILQICYAKFPFFLETLMQVTDAEFADAKKSVERKKIIQIAYNKNPPEIKKCLSDLIQYTKDQNDPADLKYTIKRLSEVSSIAYPTTQSKPNADSSGTAK